MLFATGKGIATDDPNALARLRSLSAEDVTDGLNLEVMFNPAARPRTYGCPFPDGKIAVDSGVALKSGAFAIPYRWPSHLNAFRKRTPRMNLRPSLLGLALVLFSATASVAQTSTTEQELIQLSKNKWQWMADRDVEKLAPLFHDRSKFVHMSGTWKKDEELDIIKTGRIWYKQADVHDVAVQVFDNTAIVWSRITLSAIVRGTDAKTEFTVTEVFQKQGSDWKILALTFSSVRDTHEIQK